MTQSAGRYPILVDPSNLFLRHRDPLAVAGAVYYHNVVIALDSQGRGAKATGAANLKIVGFYDGETFTAVATDRVSVSHGVIPMVNSSTDPVTIADLKNVVYLEGDDTIARTSAGGTLSPGGILELYEDSTPKVQIGGLPPALVSPSTGSLLLHAPVADQTALQAIVANERADGMICVDLTTNLEWTFDAASAAGADDWTRVPAAGSGRWVRKDVSLVDLAATTAAHGAHLIGSQDLGDHTANTTTETQVQEIYLHIHSVQKQVSVAPLSGGILAAGTPLAAFADSVTSDPGITLANSKAVGVRWNNAAGQIAVWYAVPMPQDLNDAANVVMHILASKTGATVGDATTFTVTAFFQTVGALHDADADCGGASSAMTGAATAKTVQELTLTLALADVPPSPSVLSFSIKPTDGTLGTDDVVVEGIWFEYKGATLAS